MPIITLTTDFGSVGYYTAAVKGKILSICSNANITDVCNNIPSYHINQAAYILKNAWHHFPEGTIHIAGVLSMLNNKPRYIMVKQHQHYFIGSDNGLFSLLFGQQITEMYKLHTKDLTSSFPELDYFAPAAAHLANGKTLTEIAQPIEQIKERIPLQATFTENTIKAAVLFIDAYQNIILNVDKTLFEKVGKQRPFSILYNRGDFIDKLYQHYGEIPSYEKCCIFNAAGYLQISMNQGNAAGMFGIDESSVLLIEFAG